MQLLLRPRFGLGACDEYGICDTSEEAVAWSADQPPTGGYVPGATDVNPVIDPETGLPMVWVTSQPELPPELRNIIPAGQKAGAMKGPVPPLSSSQLTSAIAAGTVVLSKSLTGAAAGKVCPSGYATPQGQCVSLAGGGVSAPIIPGVSNQTLLLMGIALFALVMIGGRKR